MTLNVYEYTTRDLIAGPPQSYMYSRFENGPFLACYLRDRAASIARFESAAEAPESGATDGSEQLLPAIEPVVNIDTTHLVDVLATMAQAGVRGERTDYWVDVIARKFEVAKRLRSRYTPALRVVDDSQETLDSYARAAFAIAVNARTRSRLRLLNCLLKINDLVSSSGAALSPQGSWYAAEALRMELQLVHDTAASQNVSLPPT